MPRPDDHLIIMTTTDSSGKIYIRDQFGYFQRLRRYIASALMLLFIGLPWLNWHGQQAVRIDVDRFAIEWFGVVLLPSDFAVLALLFALAAFALFYLTKLYGRIWCGYTCPQTIWTLLFVWVERRIEGPAAKRKALDAQPWRGRAGLHKLALRLVKHSLWALLALATALVFVSYFVPARQLFPAFVQGDASGAVASWVWFFAICTYLNAGLVREKMCLHMCPYARFQSSMFDSATRLVSYDASRGEARGARKKSADKPAELGDCVDCKLCVQVCPVGIDIRQGLQYECINCGLCIDACDDTMRQFNYPTGLIRYHADKTPRGIERLKRHGGYGGAILLLCVAALVWFNHFHSSAMTISRDRQQLARVRDDGHIENTFTLRVSNKLRHTRQYQVLIEGLPGGYFAKEPQLQLQAAEDKELVVTVLLPSCPTVRFVPFGLVLVDQQSGERVAQTASFYRGDCQN